MLLGSLCLAGVARAATVIYDDELRPGWTSWSWGGDFAFDHSDEVLSGSHSISVTVEQFGALSLHSDEPFPGATGVAFWLRGSGESLVVFLHADGYETITSDQIAIADLVESGPGDWVFVGVDFGDLVGADWTRVNIMNTSEDDVSFLVEEIVLLGVDLYPVEEPLDEVPDAGVDAADEPPGVADVAVDVGEEVVSDLDEADDVTPDEDTGGAVPAKEEDSFCRSAHGRPGWPSLVLLALVVSGWLRRRERRMHGTG